MRNDGWKSDPPVPKARPLIANPPAKGYSRPEIERVAVAIESDEDCFRPSSCASDGSAAITANIPSGNLVMPEGASAVIDCGFSLEMPAGYRCRLSSSVPGLVMELVDAKRFKVNAINLGRETILHDRESIGRIWIEPVHFFEWITRG